jgi:hypothetical protein
VARFCLVLTKIHLGPRDPEERSPWLVGSRTIPRFKRRLLGMRERSEMFLERLLGHVRRERPCSVSSPSSCREEAIDRRNELFLVIPLEV